MKDQPNESGREIRKLIHTSLMFSDDDDNADNDKTMSVIAERYLTHTS